MKRKIIPYNPELKERAKELRKNMTLSEIMLWNELKRKQLKGFDFDRQRPIDNYIVDFYCKDLMLAIEIDGESHIGKEEYDVTRQEKLEQYGVTLLRFDDLTVRQNLDSVVKEIEEWIDKNFPESSHHTLPGRITSDKKQTTFRRSRNNKVANKDAPRSKGADKNSPPGRGTNKSSPPGRG